MAEERQQLCGINWQETFSFTHVFRGFRLAVHPSKLVLAFVGLALCFVGGLVLDNLWYGGPPIIWEDGRPLELTVFAEKGTAQADFSTWHDNRLEERERALKRLRKEDLGLDADELNIRSAGVSGKIISRRLDLLEERLDQLESRRDDRIKRIGEIYKDDEKRRIEEKNKVNKKYPQDELETRREAYQQTQRDRDLVGTGPARRGPFRALLKYEMSVFDELVTSAVNLNLLGGLEVSEVPEELGVVAQIRRGFKGLQWLLWQHWIYFIIFGTFCLLVWSIFGGSISRIAALHVARGEKISLKEALQFGVKKFPSFFFAPLIPIAIVAFLGLLVLLGSLIVGNWGWGIGEVLLSLLFFLSLIAGFVMSLVAVGTVGGLNLMFPTIAVEGSDSFDAISRSFSYVYNKPWRMILYSVVALIYGVLCYLFVRFFAFLVLKMTHVSVGMGIFTEGNSQIVNKFSTMWPAPQFLNLHGGFDWGACWGTEAFGAWVIAFWVYVVIGFVAAFVVSFFFSANTMIYYLMRNKVDAADMDDVYVEEEPDEEAPPVTEQPGEAPKAEPPESEEKPQEPSEGEDEKPTSEGDT